MYSTIKKTFANANATQKTIKEKQMSKKVIIIPTDRDPYVVDVPTDEVSYELLSESVEGMIEPVILDYDLDMWVNEEGKIMSLPVNPIATLLWLKFFGPTDIIMGNAVITGGTDMEGNTLGLSEEDADSFMALLQVLVKSEEN